MTLPPLDLLVVAPAVLPALGAVLVLVADALLPRRRGLHLGLGGLALLGAAGTGLALRLQAGADGSRVTLCTGPTEVLTGHEHPSAETAPGCLLEVTALGAQLQVLVALSGLAVLVLLVTGLPRGTGGDPGRTVPGDEVDAAVPVALVLTAAAGAASLLLGRDLGTWLVSLELATIPIIGLVALGRVRGSATGALTLLTTSLLSFALAAVGAALWVTATGSIRLHAAAAVLTAEVPAGTDPDAARAVAAVAVLVMVAGVAFKLSLAPFHAWAPTTYARAGLPAVALLVTVSTIAGLGALLAVVEAATPLGADGLTLGLGALAVASMLGGAVMALRQDDPLRLLAWSGVTQAGWVVLALAVPGEAGRRASVGYLSVYAVATLTALAVVGLTSRGEGRSLRDVRGLARRNPLQAGALAMALLTLAGLPPGVPGLLAKVGALGPGTAAGHWWLVLPAVVAAVIGIAVYLRWLALVIAPADEPEAHDEGGEAPAPVGARATSAVAAAGLVVLVAASAAPWLLLP